MDFNIIKNEKNGKIEDKGNGKVIITAGKKTDFFISPSEPFATGIAPLALKQIDKDGPLTLTAKVRPDFNREFDGGVLFIYINKEKWIKFGYELDEYGRKQIVSVRTEIVSDDNNHRVIDANVDEIFIRISKKGSTWGLYHSIDGEKWEMARILRFEVPETEKLYIGISSQSPVGDENRTVFSEISIINKAVKDFRAGIIE